MTRAILVAAILFSLGCSGPSCGEDSISVAKARALSQTDLIQVHEFMLARDGTRRGHVDDFSNVPRALKVLNPEVIDRESGYIYLELCSIDTKVMLEVRDLRSTGRFVKLHWGDWRSDDGSPQVLWHSTSDE